MIVVEYREASGLSRDMRPLRRTYLYEQVASEIRAYIAQNKLQPGDRLASEQELCTTLGVSRASLREGLRLLQMLGIIESRVGEGTFVKGKDLSAILTRIPPFLSQSRDELMELLEAREGLEIQACRLAAARVTPADVDHIRSILETTRHEAAAGADCSAEDMAFHRAIFQTTRNGVLLRLLDAITAPLSDARRKAMKHAGPARTLEQHEALFAILCEGDEDKLVATMQAHLQLGAADMLEALARDADGAAEDVERGAGEGG